MAETAWTTFLLRYGEIGVKSRSVRRRFEDQLESNLRQAFTERGATAVIDRVWGRFYLESPSPDVAREVISRTFGLVHASPVTVVDADLDAIDAEVRKLAPDVVEPKDTFAIRARRTGDHDFQSPDVGRRAGAVVLDEVPEAEVDLDDPDREIHVEVRHDEAFVFTEFIEAPGGLPRGSQGEIVVPIEGPRGPAAAWLAMRRGAEVHALVPAQARGLVDGLAPWAPGMKVTLLEGDVSRAGLLAAAERLAEDVDANAIALAEHESRAAETQSLETAVVRPLAGLPGKRWPEGAYRVSKDAAEAHPGTCLDKDGMGPKAALAELEAADTIELEID